jgi:hypothetical protein
MKMCLVMVSRRAPGRGSRAARRSVHAHGERAQLFEALPAFELGGRRAGEAQQRLAAPAVDAEVSQGPLRRRPVRDRAAREVQRAPAVVEHQLHQVGVGQGLGVVRPEAPGQRDQLLLAVGEALHQPVQVGRIQFGLVTLYVQDQLDLEAARHLGHAVPARGVVAARHLDPRPEVPRDPGDALVVRGHDHRVQPLRAAHGFPDVLDQRLAGPVQERLAGQACGGIADRQDGRRAGAHGLGSKTFLPFGFWMYCSPPSRL